MALLLLSLFLASCTTNKAKDALPTDEYIPPTIDESSVIDFVFRGYGSSGQPYNKSQLDAMLEALTAKLTKDMPAEVTFTWIPHEGYLDKILEAIASDSCPDAVALWYYSDEYRGLENEGLLLDKEASVTYEISIR